ncbi:MAG: hypothetical protein P1V36_02930 [Planctomycetota bacterium]|nr:hypothetical protein [Planctomycetota bacterium]
MWLRRQHRPSPAKEARLPGRPKWKGISRAVPARFRKLRLRKKRARVAGDAAAGIVVVLFMLFFVAFVVVMAMRS